MKKSILGGLLVFVFTFAAVFLVLDNRQETYALHEAGAGGTAMSPDSRFPNINFYNCLKDLGVGMDSEGKVTDWSLRTTQSISCPKKNIESAVGIELFPNLGYINLSENKLTSINLGNKYALATLNLSHNSLTTIDLGKTAILTSVNLSYNKLTSIKNFDSKGLLDQAINLAYNNFSSIPKCCQNNPKSCLFGVVVKFDLNGGTGSINSQNITVEGKVTKPSSNPTKSGYDFQCWARNDVCWDFSNYTQKNQYANFPPTSISNWTSFTLKAKWKAKTNGGAGNGNGNGNGRRQQQFPYFPQFPQFNQGQGGGMPQMPQRRGQN